MAEIKINKGKRKIRINKNVLVMVIAVACGGLGIHAANTFIQSQLAAYKEKNNVKVTMIQVVVPNKDLPRGYRITPQDLSIREIPAEYADKGAVSPNKYKVAIGQSLSYPIAKGNTLLWAHLESGETGTFAGTLPNGKRAISFSVDKINSISGFLEPKDRIDLMLTYTKNKKKITAPIIQNLLVLATDKRTQTDKFAARKAQGGETSYKTLTVEVSPEEAEKIILAQEEGKLTAVLRHPEDDKLLSKTGMTFAKLFDEESQKKRVAKKRLGIEYIIGGANR